MKTNNGWKVGDLLEITDDSDVYDYMKEKGFIKGNTRKIRSIGEQDFHKDGGGIRLEGIYLPKDLTGYEMAFSRKRFKKV